CREPARRGPAHRARQRRARPAAARCWPPRGRHRSWLTPRISTTGKARRALLAESGYALGVVGAAAELALVIAPDVELFQQGPVQAFVNRLLGAGESTGRRGRELQCQAFHHRRELRVLDASPDQTPACCLLGRQFLPEEREAERTRRADETRQEPGA